MDKGRSDRIKHITNFKSKYWFLEINQVKKFCLKNWWENPIGKIETSLKKIEKKLVYTDF